jgi:hypothetical protein
VLLRKRGCAKKTRRRNGSRKNASVKWNGNGRRKKRRKSCGKKGKKRNARPRRNVRLGSPRSERRGQSGNESRRKNERNAKRLRRKRELQGKRRTKRPRKRLLLSNVQPQLHRPKQILSSHLCAPTRLPPPVLLLLQPLAKPTPLHCRVLLCPVLPTLLSPMGCPRMRRRPSNTFPPHQPCLHLLVLLVKFLGLIRLNNRHITNKRISLDFLTYRPSTP